MVKLIEIIVNFFTQIGDIISVVVDTVVFIFSAIFSSIKFVSSSLTALPALFSLIPSEIYIYIFLAFQLLGIAVVIKLVRGS